MEDQEELTFVGSDPGRGETELPLRIRELAQQHLLRVHRGEGLAAVHEFRRRFVIELTVSLFLMSAAESQTEIAIASWLSFCSPRRI